MIEFTVALILFLFPLAYSPGPGNLIFAANGAQFGFWATWPANLGYHLATWVVTCAIGFGFLGVMDRFPQVFALMTYGGAGYVLWLAWKMIRAGALEGAEASRPLSFGGGAVLLVLNPKAYMIIALMFTQFLGASEMSVVRAVLWITTVFTLNNCVAFCLWTVLGDRIATVFRSEEHARRMNLVFGVVLAAVAVWMILA